MNEKKRNIKNIKMPHDCRINNTESLKNTHRVTERPFGLDRIIHKHNAYE